MTLRKVASSAFLFSTGLYILLPTPDELVIYPTLGLFFSYAFHIPFIYGVLLSMVVYRGVGVTCLLGALILGGKPIYFKLKEKILRIERNQKSKLTWRTE
jgi:hypothetical protein